MTNPPRRTDEALHVQREWLRVTLSSIGDAVITTDIRGDVGLVSHTLIDEVRDGAGVRADLTHSLHLLLGGGAVPSVAFPITPKVW